MNQVMDRGTASNAVSESCRRALSDTATMDVRVTSGGPTFGFYNNREQKVAHSVFEERYDDEYRVQRAGNL